MERYVIHVTKECNCDCLYCYEKDKTSKYTWEEIKELIDNIIKNRTSDQFGIEFLGGEPLLAWDYVKKSYEYLESFPNIYIEDYGITTNGTILTDEIIDYLSKNPKMHFAASMDGHAYANQLRVFKDSRKNTHDIVLKNLKILREAGVKTSIHIVSHLYNVAFLADSIDHLYKEGVRHIEIGTIESTMIIDEQYCNRFISELDKVSRKMVEGKYPGLSIGQFEYVKSYNDIRSYIRDPKTGKVIAESYGRSGEDITHTDTYNVQRCDTHDKISDMIYSIRKKVYDNHQERLRG